MPVFLAQLKLGLSNFAINSGLKHKPTIQADVLLVNADRNLVLIQKRLFILGDFSVVAERLLV